MKIITSPQGIIEEKGTASVRAPYKVRVSMLALDVFLGNLMTLTAVLVLLKIKNVIMWDWGTVLSPVCVVLLMKGFLILLNHAFQ